MNTPRHIRIHGTASFNFNDFYIDLASSDEEVLHVDVDGFTVSIRRALHGIEVSLFPLHVGDEPIAQAGTQRMTRVRF